jgi:hypothetical protein
MLAMNISADQVKITFDQMKINLNKIFKVPYFIKFEI